jgi:hypothetical protein
MALDNERCESVEPDVTPVLLMEPGLVYWVAIPN